MNCDQIWGRIHQIFYFFFLHYLWPCLNILEQNVSEKKQNQNETLCFILKTNDNNDFR